MRLMLFVLVGVFYGSVASAQTIDGTSPRAIVDILQGEGYRASLTTDRYGDPKIDSSSQGVNWSIWFYDCTNNRDCRSIQYAASFDLSDGISPNVLNDFARENRYGRVYYDQEFNPYIELDANLAGGVSRANFIDTLQTWGIVLGDFLVAIDWN